MSMYRRLLVAFAAMGLATSVFAADEATTTDSAAPAATESAAPADAAPAPSAEATPAAESTPAAAPTQEAAATDGDKVDLNKASVKELMKLKGMSAAKAKAIVTYRKKHGDFKSIDDLKEVKGFKKLNEKKWNEITSQLTIG